MSWKTKLRHEVMAIFWTSLYFLGWFGGMMVLKVLLLHEYQLEFYGASMVVVGALVAAKSVLILENVKNPRFKQRAAIAIVLQRTLLYMLGVFLILVLEKSIESRQEYGGVISAMKELFQEADSYHIWANTLCVFGALLFYNLWSVLKRYLGDKGILHILRSPIPGSQAKD